MARPQLRTSHARNTLVRYLSHLAYKQPTGLFALRLSLMRGANIIGSRELAGHGIATISGNGVEHFLSGIHLTGGYGRRH